MNVKMTFNALNKVTGVKMDNVYLMNGLKWDFGVKLMKTVPMMN
jgi:hypothetical protein